MLLPLLELCALDPGPNRSVNLILLHSHLLEVYTTFQVIIATRIIVNANVVP